MRKKKFDIEDVFSQNGNIAFLDAEFNAGMDYKRGENISEIISIGLIICDSQFNGLKKYYSLVSGISNNPVFPMITRMTGITTKMLEGQPDFMEVSKQVSELVKRYNVTKIFTWGAADKHSLQWEKSEYRRKRLPGYQQSSKWNYIDLCTDISGVVSSQILGIKGGLSINMENLMFVCNINKKQEHNALSDAYYLYKCIKFLREKHISPDDSDEFGQKKELVNRYYQEKSLYNSFRRFKSTSKGNDLYGKRDETDASCDMRIKALEDDIRFLKGEISYDSEFDTIQEYFEKNKNSDCQ